MIMLKLIASNHIKKDQLEKFTALAKELIMKSRAEEGNLSYSINGDYEKKSVKVIM